MNGVAVSDGSHIGAANGWARIAVTIRHHQAPSPSGGTLHRPVLAMPTKHEAACSRRDHQPRPARLVRLMGVGGSDARASAAR